MLLYTAQIKKSIYVCKMELLSIKYLKPFLFLEF